MRPAARWLLTCLLESALVKFAATVTPSELCSAQAARPPGRSRAATASTPCWAADEELVLRLWLEPHLSFSHAARGNSTNAKLLRSRRDEGDGRSACGSAASSGACR